MLIERVEAIPIKVKLPFTYQGSTYRMRNRCTIVTRLYTEDGIIGEAYNADEDSPAQEQIVRILLDEVAPRVIGLDAFQVERCWESMLPPTFDQLRPRWYVMQAIACIDTAIWDAVGKALRQPLWRLWGGYRSCIPAIGIGGYYIPDTAEAKGQEIEREIDFFKGEQGMVGMKFKIGGKAPAEDVQRLLRARRHAGDDFVFIVDANQAYTVSEALSFMDAARAAGLRIRWFEEPTRWHADFRGLRDVRLRGNVPVAAGQSEISRVGMRELMVNGAIDVSNYDASWGGGPTEWRRVAALASAFDVQLGHHEEAHVAAHLLASVPHGTYVELFSPARDPIYWQMLENRPTHRDGQFRLTEEPGLGWVLDQAFIKRYRIDC